MTLLCHQKACGSHVEGQQHGTHAKASVSHTSDDFSAALLESLNTELLRERFEATLRQIWRSPGSLAKDLPRLARRVTIRTREGVVFPLQRLSALGSAASEASSGSGALAVAANAAAGAATETTSAAASVSAAPTPQATFQEIRVLVLTLVHSLEPERLDDVSVGLESIAAAISDHTDLEMVVPEVTALLGPDSRAQRVLNFINQNVVLLGVTTMKEGPCRGMLTKDVRSADGWRVGIDLYEWVQVHHTRREQSVDMFGDTLNHYELDYEVRATFPRDMSELCSGGLKVLNLTCANTMAQEKRRELESRLLGDVIIL
ncbi:unnamed protein product [Phaeothamnion confervicola]